MVVGKAQLEPFPTLLWQEPPALVYLCTPCSTQERLLHCYPLSGAGLPRNRQLLQHSLYKQSKVLAALTSHTLAYAIWRGPHAQNSPELRGNGSEPSALHKESSSALSSTLADNILL